MSSALHVDPQRSSAHLLTCDVARILAMTAIVFQHVLPMYELPLKVHGFPNLGQLGVSVFCVLSGFFAFRNPRVDRLTWLRKRLMKLAPSYWIAVTAVFCLNALVGYKPVGLRTVVLEYAGLGALLDEQHRVGQALWFITLILTCYTLAVFLRGHLRLAVVAIVVTTMFMSSGHWFATHIVSFLLGGIIASAASSGVGWFLIPFVALLAFTHDKTWLYPLSAAVCLTGCHLSMRESPLWLAKTSELTYEFFLVHGPVYLLLAKYARMTVVANLVLGTLLAAAAAYLLGWSSAKLRQQFQRWIETRAAGVPDIGT